MRKIIVAGLVALALGGAAPTAEARPVSQYTAESRVSQHVGHRYNIAQPFVYCSGRGYRWNCRWSGHPEPWDFDDEYCGRAKVISGRVYRGYTNFYC